MSIENLYTDPYEKQINNQYEGDPRSKENFAQSAVGLVKNLAVFALATEGIRRGAPLFAKWGTQIAEKVVGKDIASVFQSFNKRTTGLLSNLTSSQKGGASAYKDWKENWDTAEKLTHTRGLSDFSAKNFSKYTDRYSNFYKDKISDFFTAPRFAERLTGKVMSSAKVYGSQAVEFYAASKLLHITRIDRQENAPAWYDVPGHIKDFAKFTLVNTPTQMAFNMFSPAFKYAKETLGRGTVAASAKIGVEKYAPMALHKASKGFDFIASAIRATDSFYQHIKSNTGSLFSLRGFERTISTAKQTFSSSFRNQTTSRGNVSQSSFLNHVLSNIRDLRTFKPNEQRAVLNRALTSYHKTSFTQFLNRSLGLRKPSMSEADMHSVVSKVFSNKEDQGWWMKNLKSLNKRGVPLYDKGVFKHGQGTIDLRSVMPLNILGKTFQFLNQHAKLGGSQLMSLFRFDLPFKLQNNNFTRIETGTQIPLGLGPHSDSRGVVSFGSGRNEINEGVYVGGQFFGKRKEGAMELLHGKDQQFYYFATAQNSLESQVMSNYAAINVNKSKDAMAEIRRLTPIGKFIRNGLDFKKFASGDSFIGKMLGSVGKYFDNKSPLYWSEISEKATTDPAMYESYRRAVGSILHRGSSHASTVFKNPEVLKTFGVDATISDSQLWNTVSSRVTEISKHGSDTGERLLHRYGIKTLVRQTENNDIHYMMDNVRRREGMMQGVTNRDLMFEFLAADNVFRSNKIGTSTDAMGSMINLLQEKGSIKDIDASALRIWSIDHDIRKIISSNGENGINADIVSGINNIMGRHRKDVDSVIGMLSKPTVNILGRDEAMDILADRARIEQWDPSYVRYNGYTAIPKLGTKARFVQDNDYLTANSQKAKHEFEVGPGGVFNSMLALRFNKVLGFTGMGLSMDEYKTGSKYLFKGLMARRVLPMAGLAAGYAYLDRAVDVAPMFDGSLHYDELVIIKNRITNNIELIEIGKFVDEYKCEDYDAWTNNDGIIDWKTIKGGIKHKREVPVARVQLSSYSDILVTTNHSLFSGSENKLVQTIPNLGIDIMTCSAIPKQEIFKNELCILDEIKAEEKYQCIVNNLNYRVMNYIRNIKHNYESSYNIKLDSKYLNWIDENVKYYKGRYRTSIENTLKLKSEFRKDIELGWKESKKKIPINYKLDYELGRLIGFYVSEGSVCMNKKSHSVSFAASDSYNGYKGNIRDKIVSDIKHVFGDIEIRTSKTDIRLNGILYVKLFKDIFKCGMYAENKVIPNFILNGNKEIQKGFLEGYFLGDGHLHLDSSIIFTTVSRKLAIQVVYLLKLFDAQVGLYSRFRDGDTYIKGRKINNNFREYDITTRGIKCGDFYVEKSYDKRTLRKDNLSGIINEIEIIKDQPEFVYDISVDTSEKFVGGFGFIYAHNTMLDEGISVAAAEQGVKARMMFSSVYDQLGITNAAKYAEGLMPGFVNSPAMRFLRGVAAPISAGALIGGQLGGPGGTGLGMMAGAAIGLMQGFGTFDLTKNRDELEDIYSGREEVPVRRGRWWMIGSGNFQGSRIQYFRPNWFARMKSKYQDTPEGFGSPMEQMLYKPLPVIGFNPLGAIISPNHYAYKHYYSMPYPETGTPFGEVPFIGPLASMFGSMNPLWASRRMHNEDLGGAISAAGYRMYHNNMPLTGTYSHGSASVFRNSSIEENALDLVSGSSVGQEFDAQLYNFTEAAGLWGFGLQTAMEKTTGGRPFESQNVMANASEITSFRRAYWDRSIGEPLPGMTEVFRRFIPRERKLNLFNPLINTQPSWMPDKFHIGSPLAAIPEAELLLPGRGYESAHDVRRDYPVNAEMLGLSVPDTIRSMLGLYPHSPTKYSSDTDIDRKNMEIMSASNVFDPYSDINGEIDGVTRYGKYQFIKKIKQLRPDDLEKFQGPQNSDISEMNFYLKQKGAQMGVVSYQFNGKPILNVPVRYSQSRYVNDINTVKEARRYAEKLYENGVGFGSESYSHIDRLKILGNVAPYSEQYKREENIVRLQMKAGYDYKDDLEKIKRKRKALMMSREFYPYRFLNKVMTPDSEYNNMSLNENIKAASEYSLPERIMGAAWEGLSHMSTPIHNKFMNYRSPLEAYQRSTLYGRDMKLWSSPVDHFANAYARGFMSKTSPISGSIAGAIGGTVTLGPGFGTVAGAAAGAVYGGIHGVYRAMTDTTYIPGVIREARSINRYFDKVTYAKNMYLYQATGDESFKDAADSTMTGLKPGDPSREGWSRLYRATPQQEKPYLMAFIGEQDPEERVNILKYVPEEVGAALRVKWGTGDESLYNGVIAHNMTDPIPSGNWIGYNPDVPIADVKMKFIEDRGLDYHDFGLGFGKQMSRINRSPWLDRVTVDMKNLSTKEASYVRTNESHEIRRSIESILQSAGINGTVTITPSAQNTVNVIGI